MQITVDTKISVLIKANPASIEALASINPHFEKLRNPILRRVLASRVTIAEAAKIGGCSVNDFFKKLQPLGFEAVEYNTTKSPVMANERPVFMKEISPNTTTTLDVRADLTSGKDPFQKIMGTLSSMPQGNFLLIINTFEPLPLIKVLQKKGFTYYTEKIQENLFYTYLAPPKLLKEMGNQNTNPSYQVNGSDRSSSLGSSGEVGKFDEMLNKFKGNLETIDVRNLEMPMPMLAILKELETIPEEKALFVQHKKIPQFLLPELVEKKFSWLIREDGEGDIKLLIYR